jgi:magnesium-transporting ATPase (P-type)
MLEFCELLANDGLRTLAFTQKELTEQEVDAFMTAYDQAANSVNDREANLAQARKLIETEMDFIGVSGVEDRLQEDVQKTIESLKGAGIQIWMLTGDRVETGTSIAISAGLKSRQNELYYVTEHLLSKRTEEEQASLAAYPAAFSQNGLDFGKIKQRLDAFKLKAKRAILIVDGNSLDAIMESS